ncbi:hypothetical protein CEE37_09015 [candidate division LCP-89 bacterium B3_LCP]|uniref:Fibronectin type-III domain-containing protein n=1 Tax=candidate division LCP-89 bacterium B3_LCP TaxID=2012998 RepID=A0A532UZR0_UNCL8|nr:MAG: hypothetical protein CEE37_09015 [candidate division LCP-89 bacterium B3_LCP]
MKRLIFSVTALLLIFLLFNSCSQDTPTEPEPEPEVIIADNAVVMDSTEFGSPTIVGDNYSFTFTGAPPDINVDDVIVGVTDGGFLRKVTGVQIDSNTVTLTTEQAALTDIVEVGSFQETIDLQIGSNLNSKGLMGLETRYLADGVTLIGDTLDLSGVELFSGQVSGVEILAEITDGLIAFNPSLDIGVEISWFQLVEFHAIATGELIFDCDVLLTCDGEISHDYEITIAEFSTILVQMIGPIPVVEIITLSFDAGYETYLQLEGEVGAGCDALASVSVGAQYQNETWESIWETNTELNGHPVEWAASAEVMLRGYVKPRISIDFYAVAGPYLEGEPYLKFLGAADLIQWNYALSGGLDARLGFQVQVLSYQIADFYTELLEWEMVILADSGEYTLDIPVLSYPLDNAQNQPTSMTFSWQEIVSADDYHLQVSTDQNFGSTFADVGGIDSTSYAATGMAYNTQYYWRARSHGTSGYSGWSDVWSFTTGDEPPTPPPPPILSTPPDNAQNQSTSPTLSWNSSSGAEDYHLQVSTSSQFSSTIYDEENLTSTSQSVTGLDYETEYFWRVRAHNSAGYSDWSDVWSFTTEEQGSGGEMVLIPAGEFIMGSETVGGSATPEHPVYLDAYWIDKYEVNNYEYKLFCDATGGASLYPPDPGFSTMPNYFLDYPNYPVVNVDWFDASDYAAWAGKRLPTEAEWERAAKGDQDNRLWPWGDDFNALIGGTTYHANVSGTADGWQYTAPVGTYPTGVSPAGCYDMAGNVWEWCNDWYDYNYYSSSPYNNPPGPTSGPGRVLRGGSWDDGSSYARCARRGWLGPWYPHDYIGFRCSRTP